jgi:hypothetical protein
MYNVSSLSGFVDDNRELIAVRVSLLKVKLSEITASAITRKAVRVLIQVSFVLCGKNRD